MFNVIRQSTHNITLRRVCETIVAVQRECAEYSESACIALDIQQAKCLHLSGSTTFFHIIS